MAFEGDAGYRSAQAGSAMTTIYGLKCLCHGVRFYATPSERDKYAITYLCRQEWFRIEDAS